MLRSLIKRNTRDYSPLKEEHSSATQQHHGRSSLFSGRKVTLAKGEKFYTHDSVSKRLGKQYGSTIRQQLMRPLKQQRLSERKVRRLFIEAERVQTKTAQKNHKNLQKWLDISASSSPLAKALDSLCPCCYHILPAAEQVRMHDYLMQKMSDSQTPFTKNEVELLCIQYLKDYKSGFMHFAPATSNFLQPHLQTASPVFDAHLSQLTDHLSDPEGSAKELLTVFHRFTLKAQALIQASPFEQRGERSFTQQLQKTRFLLMQIQGTHDYLLSEDNIALPEDLKEALLNDLMSQQEALKKHMAYLMVLKRNDFVNAKNMSIGYKLHLNTATKVLDAMIAEAEQEQKETPENSRYEKQIETWEQLKQQLEILKKRVHQMPLPESPVKALAEYKSSVQKMLKKNGIPSSKLSRLWRTAWTETTNDHPAKPINKLVTVRHNDEFVQYQSVIRPAAALRFHAHQPASSSASGRDPFKHSYRGKACSSSTKYGTQHAVNLQQTQLKTIPTASVESSSELFSAIRSGTTAAQHIEDREQRTKAANNWAREVATAALLNKMERSPETREKVLAGEPVSLNMLSSSLLTADHARHISHINDDELQLQREQYQALHSLAASDEPLVIYDAQGNKYQVKIALEVATFNLGVNLLSLNPVVSTLLSSWSQANKYNEDGLTTLVGDVGLEAPLGGWVQEWLQNNQDHPKAKIVIQLAHQLKTLFNNKMYQTEGSDAYKFVSRLVLLAYYIGVVPHFSCKSGKDRTGEADACIKALICEIEQTGKVPPLEKYLTTENKELAQAMMYGAGEQEVLLANSGNTAFKTYTGKAIQGRLFSFLHPN